MMRARTPPPMYMPTSFRVGVFVAAGYPHLLPVNRSCPGDVADSRRARSSARAGKGLQPRGRGPCRREIPSTAPVRSRVSCSCPWTPKRCSITARSSAGRRRGPRAASRARPLEPSSGPMPSSATRSATRSSVDAAGGRRTGQGARALDGRSSSSRQRRRRARHPWAGGPGRARDRARHGPAGWPAREGGRAPDRPRGVGDCARHRLADPPGRVGGELEAFAPVELLDGTDQAEHALLNQVEERQPLTSVVLRDRDDEAQVAADHLVLGPHVASLDPLRERRFLRGVEQRVAADFVEEELQESTPAPAKRSMPDRFPAPRRFNPAGVQAFRSPLPRGTSHVTPREGPISWRNTQ